MLKRCLGAITLALLLAMPTVAQERIAVLDTELPRGIDPKVIIPVTEKIMEEFVRSKLFTVLDRAFINKTLSELEFSTTDLTAGDSEKLATIGGFLKATYIVVSTVQQLDRTYFLSAKMIEVKTGVITAQASVNQEGSIAVLIDMAGDLGRKLVAAAMGQDSVATSRPSGRLGAPETTQMAPDSSLNVKEPDTPPQKPQPKSPEPKKSFSSFSLDLGASALTAIIDNGSRNGSWDLATTSYTKNVDFEAEPLSGLSIGASTLFPFGLFYFSAGASYWNCTYSGSDSYFDIEVTLSGLELFSGLGINVVLGPIMLYAGPRLEFLIIQADHLSDSRSSTYRDYTYYNDFNGLGFGYEVGVDLRLGGFLLGLRLSGVPTFFAGDSDTIELNASSLTGRIGLAF